jgi:hypothetical protein
MLLIFVPLSMRGVHAFSKDRAIADKITIDNKESSGVEVEMKMTLGLPGKEIETKQNKRYVKSTSHKSDNPQKIYTIQIGSFLTFARAQNKFNSMLEELTKEYCHFLRIEKVGTFYTVRLGKFESYSSADNFIKSVDPHIPKAMIMKTNFMYDRLISCICHKSGCKVKMPSIS